jgi:hypothetical protein
MFLWTIQQAAAIFLINEMEGGMELYQLNWV